MRWPRLENDTEKWQTILDNYPCRKAAVAKYKLVTTLHCCVPLPLPPPLANISTKLAKIVPSFYTESPVPSYRLRFNPVPSHPTWLCVLQPKCLCQSIVVFISAGLVTSAACPPPYCLPPRLSRRLKLVFATLQTQTPPGRRLLPWTSRRTPFAKCGVRNCGRGHK